MVKSKKIIIANWKMRLTHAESVELAKRVAQSCAPLTAKGELALCPNFISLIAVGEAIAGTGIKLGAQDTFWEATGAFTGEISPNLVAEVGCEYAIVGHSERRKFLGETNDIVHRELKAVLAVPELIPILCIGENWEERQAERRDFVLFEQLHQALGGIKLASGQKMIIAYEPVWAIGSGTAIEPSEAEYAHKLIRLTLHDMYGPAAAHDAFRIIYGGSVSARNVEQFTKLDNLDGLLVGGASLDAKEFYAVSRTIIR